MIDTSYCSTPCEQKNCVRNIKYNKPTEKYYSVTTFDDDNPDPKHISCIWKLLRRFF